MEPIRETISRRSYSRGSKLDPLHDSKQMTKQFIKTLENEEGFFGNQSQEMDEASSSKSKKIDVKQSRIPPQKLLTSRKTDKSHT